MIKRIIGIRTVEIRAVFLFLPAYEDYKFAFYRL